MPAPTRSPEPTSAQRRHAAAARHYAERHFTDPGLRAEDAAIFSNISERIQRESLTACGESWRVILLDLRLERAAQLLSSTNHEISIVARMCGYLSAPAFAKAFGARFKATPREFRRGKGGVARAGGPTGAFYRPAARARALRLGDEPPRRSRGNAGDEALVAVQVDEARERLEDKQILEFGRPTGVSIAELHAEISEPERLRDRPAYWRKLRMEFDAWVEENDRGDSGIPGGGS